MKNWPMKNWIVLSLVATLGIASCGSGGQPNGEVAKACLASGRDAATTRLCNCVQTAANRTLTAAEQRKAIAFFEDPQLAQDTRQSDNPSDERLWQRYKNFVSTAEAMCR